MSLAVVEHGSVFPDPTTVDVNKLVVYYGSDDQEMRELLRKLHHPEVVAAGVRAIPALNAAGHRVTPREAYHAQNDPKEAEGCFVVFAECRIEGIVPDMVADHHHEGDPGDLPPERYWEASTLGRMCMFLEMLGMPVEVSQQDRVKAAIDHCFIAATEEQCPGVTSDEAYALKQEGIAEKFRLPIAVVRHIVRAFRPSLGLSPQIEIGDQPVVDATGIELGKYFGLRYLTAQIAVAQAGKAALLRAHDSGLFARTLTGHATPEQVIAFKKDYAPKQGLTGVYGMPKRRYAGGYEPQQSPVRSEFWSSGDPLAVVRALQKVSDHQVQ